MKNIFAVIMCALFASGAAAAAGNNQENPIPDRATGAPHQAPEMFLGSAPANGLSAEKLLGKSVKNRANDEEVGSVEDLILDHDGKLVAVVVSVGGFLGIGDKDVALSWDSITVTNDRFEDEIVLHVDASEEALENAPEYERS